MKSSLANTVKSCLYAFKASKGYAAIFLVITLIAALITPLQIIILQKTMAIATKEIMFTQYAVIALVSFWMILRFSQSISMIMDNYLIQGIEMAVDKKWNLQFMESIKDSPYDIFDHSDFHHKVQLAKQHGTRVFSDTLTSMIRIIMQFVGLASVSAILWSYRPWAVALSILCCIPSFIHQNAFGRKNWEFSNSMQPELRKINYIVSVSMNKNSAKDNRALDLRSWLMNRYDKLSSKYLGSIVEFNKNHCISGILVAFIHAIGICAAIAYAYIEAANNRLTLADAVAFVGACSGIYTYVQGIIVYSTTIHSNQFWCGHHLNLLREIKSEPKTESSGGAIEERKESVCFENVSFSYAESSRKALEDISIKIPHGEHVAIVGENGAGKSTFVQLLIGLYEPENGTINMGRDTNFATYLQDFRIYSFTLGENILFGNIRGGLDIEKAWDAAKKSGVNEFIHDKDSLQYTYIGREYDDNGLILSGGQQSKLAIARAFYSNGNVLVMDEPSAALDVYAEKHLFDKLNDLSNGRTTIYVTHRLANVISADRILVFEDGHIIGDGKHEDLLVTCPTYNELFYAQAKMYE